MLLNFKQMLLKFDLITESIATYNIILCRMQIDRTY